MAPVLSGAAGAQFAATAAAVAKTNVVVGTGAAGCVGTLSVALPVTMAVLALYGSWAAMKSGQVMAALSQIAGVHAPPSLGHPADCTKLYQLNWE